MDYKKTLSGAMHRRSLLEGEGVRRPASFDRSEFRGVELDDIHDAAAMAWTARRVALGEATPLSAPNHSQASVIRARTKESKIPPPTIRPPRSALDLNRKMSPWAMAWNP